MTVPTLGRLVVAKVVVVAVVVDVGKAALTLREAHMSAHGSPGKKIDALQLQANVGVGASLEDVVDWEIVVGVGDEVVD